MSEYSSIETDRLVQIAGEVAEELSRRSVDELRAAAAARERRREEIEFELRILDKALAHIHRQLAEERAVLERLGAADHDPSPDAAVPPRAPAELPGPAETLPIVGREPEQEPEPDVPPDLAAPAAPPRPAAAAREASAPARISARDVEAKVLSTVLLSNMPLSRAQIRERTGLTDNQLTKPLRRLVDDGTILATGATVTRRYQGGERPPQSDAGARTEAGRVRNAKKMTDAVGRVGLRDRVMKAVSANPAALDNARLAQTLDADLEDIADACSYLVGKNRLQMADDGTYLRSVAEVAREIAAA